MSAPAILFAFATFFAAALSAIAWFISRDVNRKRHGISVPAAGFYISKKAKPTDPAKHVTPEAFEAAGVNVDRANRIANIAIAVVFVVVEATAWWFLLK